MVSRNQSSSGTPSQTPQYYSGFSDLITSGNTGLQSQLDWSQGQYPSLWPSGGNYLGQRQYDDFLGDLNQSTLFGGGTFQPLIFQGDLWKTRQVEGNRSGLQSHNVNQYHPYGMVPIGDAPESAALQNVRLTTDPNYFGQDVSARRYMDPSTGDPFNVVRRGDVGFVYGAPGTQQSLVTGDGSGDDDTTSGGSGDDTTTGATGDDTTTGTSGTDDTVAGTGGTDVATTSGTDSQAWQNLYGGWGTGEGGLTYQPGFNLPTPQYPVAGDRPTFTDYTNTQIINALRAENNWSIPDDTEGTYRERAGWQTKTDQQILDYMAAQPAAWNQDIQEKYQGAALAQMGEDTGQRNEFLQRTQGADLVNLANMGFLGSMGMVQNYGQGAMQEVWKNYERNIGRGRAGLASRGMTGTTVYDAMQRGAGEQSMQDYLVAQDAVTGRKIQTYQQGINGITNALNSIQYRTMHPMEYSQLYQAFGEGGAGAAVPEAPSTTTSALLGGALGLGLPFLLNSLLGPVGGAVGAAAGSSGLLGGVGDLLGGAWDWITDLF